MTIKEIRQHKNNTIRQQIFTYLIHVRKEISFIDTRFFTVSIQILNLLEIDKEISTICKPSLHLLKNFTICCLKYKIIHFNTYKT